MERLRDEAKLCLDVADYFALSALVDTLFTESDAGAFEILNRLLNEVRDEEA